METQKLTAFFLWCTIINGVILSLAIIGTAWGPEFGSNIQSHLFSIPVETVDAVTYQFLGMFKIFWLVFNLVPYIAMRIVGKN